MPLITGCAFHQGDGGTAMWDNLLTIGLFVLIGWAVLRGGGGRNPRIWSGDTPDEEARRNTRPDSNYRGYDHRNNKSDRGWWRVETLAINLEKGGPGQTAARCHM